MFTAGSRSARRQLRRPAHVRLTKSDTLAVNNGSATYVDWTAASHQAGAPIIWEKSDPSRVRAREAGWYEFDLQADFNSTTAWIISWLERFTAAGTAYTVSAFNENPAAGSASERRVGLPTIYWLDRGDYVR